MARPYKPKRGCSMAADRTDRKVVKADPETKKRPPTRSERPKSREETPQEGGKSHASPMPSGHAEPSRRAHSVSECRSKLRFGMRSRLAPEHHGPFAHGQAWACLASRRRNHQGSKLSYCGVVVV